MKLKRHINILLAALLLMSNTGFALNVHYCHGEIASVKLAYKLDEPCMANTKKEDKGCCAMKTETGKKCCKNDVVKPHDKSDNILVKSLQLDLGAFYVTDTWQPTDVAYKAPVVKQVNTSFYCEANAPPLFKLYCQYILYA